LLNKEQEDEECDATKIIRVNVAGNKNVFIRLTSEVFLLKQKSLSRFK
jgi:hypothetical protein